MMLTQDDFMKMYVKKDLDKLGIDISQNDYYKNAKFRNLEKEYILNSMFVSKSWWIEKNMVGQKRLKEIYGIYAMGIEHEFTQKELKESVWMKALADKYPEAKMEERIIGRTIKDVYQYFFRKETNGSLGLVERLKKIGFDIEKFDFTDAEKEKIKLLYFLFCFEFDNKVKIGPFLSNPTLENVDNIYVGDETRNGELMACLKNNLLKEIDWNYAARLKEDLDCIITRWEEQILYIRYMAFASKSMDLFIDINEDLEWLVSIADSDKPPVSYEDSLLETFYLKLSLHEMIGRERDLLDVAQVYSDETVRPGAYFWEKYEELKRDGTAIEWNDKSERNKVILEYIKNHRKILTQCVFEKETVTSNDYKKMDRAVDRLTIFLYFLDVNTKFSGLKMTSLLYLISYFQEFIFNKKTEKVENKFYRYKGDDEKTLNSEIANEQMAFRKNQLAWIAKVQRRYHVNCGGGEVMINARNAECKLDFLLMNVYQSNSLHEMNLRAELILSYIKTFVKKREVVSIRCNILIDILQEKDFCLSVIDERTLRNFMGSIEDEQFENFINQTLKQISNAEEKNRESELVYHYEKRFAEEQMEGFLEVTISPKEKEVKLGKWGYR